MSFLGVHLIGASSGAYLRDHNLNGVRLSEANLIGANFLEGWLVGALLDKADLTVAKLRLAQLSEVNLSGANLENSDLSQATLENANLVGANLREANFNYAEIRGVDFHFATAMLTSFGCLDLSEVYGLESIIHHNISIIGTDTIRVSKGKIPEVFLRGCGLSDLDIEYAKLYNPNLSNEEINKIVYKIYDLRATQAIQISPLFISYSHSDSAFVDKLETYLNAKGIRFWRDIHDMKSGRMEKQINRAIRQNPTVLLILSETSIKSDWVEHEVRTARDLEKEVGRDILCPVALDDSWKSSPWPKRLMEQVMEYNILPFSSWKDDAIFEQTFVKLIDGLQLFYKG